MSASEFTFLALGLVLGIASGAAIMEVLRARPPAPREVRLTLTPDSVPRRPSTLAGPVRPSAIGPAAFGPADRREEDRATWGADDPVTSRRRTGVPSVAAEGDVTGPVFGIPARPETDGVLAGIPVEPDREFVGIPVRPESDRAQVGIPVRPESDRALAALRATPVAAVAGVAVASRGMTVTALQDDGALHEAPGARESAADDPGGRGAQDPARPDPAAAACGDLRRLAAERCAVAERAATQADTAAAALRERQREADERETRVTRAATEADPHALRAAKEAAQEQFRRASAAASAPAAVEAAARTWLQEINRINGTAREAAVTLRLEREALNALVPVLEQLSVAADAARINAEASREACLAAREAVAACEEAATRERDALASAARERQAAPPPGHPPGLGGGALAGAHVDEPSEALSVAAAGPSDDRAAGAMTPPPDEGRPRPGTRVLSRLLADDRAALRALVVEAAGDDVRRQGDLQLQLSELVDAIRARAIEASQLDFPVEVGFWEPFTRDQSREIAGALGSLGYRFDGLGGFSDGRVPSQRDLSLAVGFAGLDPMRIRRWPNEAEMADLFRDVTVAADEYVAATAPGLTLGEMVAMLGRRADALAELWNEWGRIRPLLIAPV